jgi:transketolase
MQFPWGNRRATYIDITTEPQWPLTEEQLSHLETFDQIYRSLCATMFNFVPTSGHPGGSVSSGRIVASLFFHSMDYDISNPLRQDQDLISYAAGHKALGLYAMLALRNEVTRIARKDLQADSIRRQMRLEDLLGFRRNPSMTTPLFTSFKVKALDGHPTPATPFIRLSTGASGVGVASSMGLAFACRDYFGSAAPRVHIIEGEGGLTPGRVVESMASAATSGLDNVIMHLDWNQASIDSNAVCRDGDTPGDYVQWNPMELAYVNDWNVIWVPDGFDFEQILRAQHKALSLNNGQPTMIVYRTVKGWRYGIEGKASHGGGHGFCSPAYLETIKPVFGEKTFQFACAQEGAASKSSDPAQTEAMFWEVLTAFRHSMEEQTAVMETLGGWVEQAKIRLEGKQLQPRPNGPDLEALYQFVADHRDTVPPSLALPLGKKDTLRGQLGKILSTLNQVSHGAVLAAAADLLGSTSVKAVGDGFGSGFLHFGKNPESRLLSIGGICEDGMAGQLTGISGFGQHIGVASSYGAFMAPLGQLPARLHAIGNQARREVVDEPNKPFILTCAHAGLKTGEDGPTHADPQALQVLQGAFPKGYCVTLTPWDPQEIWPMMARALTLRPAVIAPFVTRPSEMVMDREAAGMAPASMAAKGVYRLISAQGEGDGVLVLQGSGVTYAFVEETWPLLKEAGIDLNVYYVASEELFDALEPDEKETMFPASHRAKAMGITGFTRPTMQRWITSERGREHTLFPFKKGHFLGSGQAEYVLHEAGLRGPEQFASIVEFLKS